MTAETKICWNCKQSFVVEPEDFAFYEKMRVSPPTWCPECRLIRRLIFRNERTLYKRKCDLCKEDKIMMYPAGAPFPVYCRQCWWSDQWGARAYARPYDPQRTFFEQFHELFLAVPRAGTVQQGNIVNSEYTNRVTDMRNCYLVFGTPVAEDSRYSTFINNSKRCVDCMNTQKSEQCYECIDCFQCYNVAFSQESSSCTGSWFLFQCSNCQDCFGCVNLRNKRYCMWNEQLTKEEYQARLKQMDLGNAFAAEGARRRFAEMRAKFIVPWSTAHHNANVSGNWIENSKNLHASFACLNVEDAKYGFYLLEEKDAMDHSYWGRQSERIYEGQSVGIQCANVRFSNECWNQLIDAEYCMNCHSSHDLFGCVGLRNAEFSILNTAYAPEEYRRLVAAIKADMTSKPYADARGRIYPYGEFFPLEHSPHAYNETLAQEFFSITKEKAAAMGYPWREPEKRAYGITMPADRLPDRIADAPDSLVNEIIGCAHQGSCEHQCTTAFRITAEDLAIHKAAILPLPRLCPNCRHYGRLAARPPLRLWKRKCQCAGSRSEDGVYGNTNSIHPSHAEGHCPNEFETPYAPERPEIVYCEQCYNAEVA